MAIRREHRLAAFRHCFEVWPGSRWHVSGDRLRARRGTIRAYEDRPVVLFKLVFLARGSTSEAFPSLSSYPRHLHHLSYMSLFGGFSFDRLGSDGPWVFFDDQANAFIFSPASHYLNAALSLAHHELTSRIAADAGQVSAGFVKTDVLVIEPGRRNR